MLKYYHFLATLDVFFFLRAYSVAYTGLFCDEHRRRALVDVEISFFTWQWLLKSPRKVYANWQNI